jgi:hypothetical protein
VAPLLANNDRAVSYVGDYDHAGTQIEANTARVLEAATGPRPWTRVALTAAQAQGLPVVTKPDRRYRPAGAMPSVEVEALGPGARAGLVRAALDGLLPAPLADVEQQQEQREAWHQVLEAGL